jgi:serine/threonine protein kinase
MNAEALIGKVLGTCTLQKLIGQGGMGAVYLAQQSRPRRQVAVKVLLPITPLASNQHAAFLERFQRETDTIASLVHPNIMPVHEYGEADGLAYLVMPYISGGTLHDEMERQGAMPLPRVLGYLDQIASALSAAHERGIIHRDTKPANILMTLEGRLLLTDFGLVKIVADGATPQARLTGIGAPMGTPDYMAPEQVLGGEIDARADLYSLGVILYQMITGITPFKGDTPIQIAMQHLQVPPPAPRSLRPDLPTGAEQVLLRALAKRPADRYMRVQDFVSAFHLALVAAGVQVEDMQVGAPTTLPAESRLSSPRPRSLFDPVWQKNDGQGNQQNVQAPTGILPPAHTPLPPQVDFPPSQVPAGYTLPTELEPARRTNVLRPIAFGTFSAQPDAASPVPPPFAEISPITGAAQAAVPPVGAPGAIQAPDASQGAIGTFQVPGFNAGATGTLLTINGYPAQTTTGTMKLTQSMKIVQVPIAGQPGRYLTGFLPVIPTTPENPPPPAQEKEKEEDTSRKGWLLSKGKTVTLLAAVFLILLSSGTFWFIHARSSSTAQDQMFANATPNVRATAAAQASATAQANIILTDPLSQNAHNWPVGSKGAQRYIFEGGAYHIINNDTHAAIALLPDETPPTSFAYMLSFYEVKGNDSSVNNQFGLVVRYSTHQSGGKVSSTFYFFDIANMQGGQYQFWKYDDSFGPDVNPWTNLWSHPFGREYHFGHGPTHQNTFEISCNGSKFTFIVNGKQVGTAQDNSLASGQIGMLVNQQGTEVAFSNLLLTYH